MKARQPPTAFAEHLEEVPWLPRVRLHRRCGQDHEPTRVPAHLQSPQQPEQQGGAIEFAFNLAGSPGGVAFIQEHDIPGFCLQENRNIYVRSRHLTTNKKDPLIQRLGQPGDVLLASSRCRKKEGNKSAARAISSSRHGVAPRIDGRCAKGSVCSG
jgi:hypothetical protein